MTSTHPDLRISLLTPVGRGALAVVALSGKDALASLKTLFFPRGVPLVARPDNAVIFGRWGHRQHGEELVVVRRSQTSFEVHCHGGLAASETVMTDLVATGAIRQTWKEWLSSHALMLNQQHGRLGQRLEIEHEARQALAATRSPLAARILCNQLSGVLADEIERIELLKSHGNTSEVHDATNVLLNLSRVGLRLIRPWSVVVIGPANAGKSSLINALAGYARTIVSQEPGTTRDTVETRMVLNGWELDLVDTAGIRELETVYSESEKKGIQKAHYAAKHADLVIHVQPPPVHSLPARPTFFDDSHPLTLWVLSKCDLIPDSPSPAGFVKTSASKGIGIQKLTALIVQSLLADLANQPELFEGPVPFTGRHVQYLQSLRDT